MTFVLTLVHNTPIQKLKKTSHLNFNEWKTVSQLCNIMWTDRNTNNSINGEWNYKERHRKTRILTYNDLPKLLKVLAKFWSCNIFLQVANEQSPCCLWMKFVQLRFVRPENVTCFKTNITTELQISKWKTLKLATKETAKNVFKNGLQY